jgi:hypothetical protein
MDSPFDFALWAIRNRFTRRLLFAAFFFLDVPRPLGHGILLNFSRQSDIRRVNSSIERYLP